MLRIFEIWLIRGKSFFVEIRDGLYKMKGESDWETKTGNGIYWTILGKMTKQIL